MGDAVLVGAAREPRYALAVFSAGEVVLRMFPPNATVVYFFAAREELFSTGERVLRDCVLRGDAAVR